MSGMAIATVCAAASKKSAAQKGLIVFIGALAGALPDLDVISLWSGFDGSIGKWLGVTHPGRDIYFGKYWYSHHAITHSVFADLVLSFLLVGLIFLKRKRFTNFPWIYPMTFFLAYQMHLFGDMPTPGSVWEGVQYWYPSDDYVGGWGVTWWWNNYDIFLLLSLCTVLNLILIGFRPLIKVSWFRRMPVAVFMGCVGLCIYQLATRDFDFNYERYEKGRFQTMEQKSLDIQRKVLGDTLFEWMEAFDNKVPVNF
jgi:inner membrane protein